MLIVHIEEETKTTHRQHMRTCCVISASFLCRETSSSAVESRVVSRRQLRHSFSCVSSQRRQTRNGNQSYTAYRLRSAPEQHLSRMKYIFAVLQIQRRAGLLGTDKPSPVRYFTAATIPVTEFQKSARFIALGVSHYSLGL